MIKLISLPVAALALLAGCDGKPLTFEATPLAATRAYADSFQDMPFDAGAISVISTEHGDVHKFKLTPCGEGLVCGTRRGAVVKTPDYHVVTGAYAGRIFYVSPGGDGWVKVNGALVPIAWN